jgi:DNA polymerase III alpha subunit (gram-positive type)
MEVGTGCRHSALDIETSGLSSAAAELIEIVVIELPLTGLNHEMFHTRLRPGMALSAAVEQLVGITGPKAAVHGTGRSFLHLHRRCKARLHQ